MKKILTILIIACGLTSCSDYLDVVPDNIPTIDHAFSNRTEARKFLFTIYSSLPSIGSVDVDPAMNGADETWQRYTNVELYWPTFQNSKIARGLQTAVTPTLDFWSGRNDGKSLWVGIRNCNIFLEKINEVSDLTDLEKKEWIAEVKFLKAYFHYYLFKCYGPIPIMDENLPVTASDDVLKVFRQPVDEVANYISALLAEAALDLPDPESISQGTDAGRVDKLVALSVRAELLLFVASPLFNGNPDFASTMIDKRGVQLFPQSYDPQKWLLAAAACKEAIDACHAHGKSLYDVEIPDPIIDDAPDEFKLQTRYRQAICAPWNQELVWGNTNYSWHNLGRHAQTRLIPITQMQNATTQWAPTLKMVGMYYSSNGVPIEEDEDWQSNGWYANRYKIRPEGSSGSEIYYVKEFEKTAYLHYNREPRFYASVGFDKGIYFGNGYYEFPTDVKYCDFLNTGVSGYQANAGHSITGYGVKKMHSFKNTQGVNDQFSFEFFPFPVIRLADLYLMYAEALNEAGGATDEIFAYVDVIRARAGLEGVQQSWAAYSNQPNKPNTKDGRREIIHRERAIELAFEGKRFWDIRRWKEINVLNDAPQGWNVQGEIPADFYRVVYVAQDPPLFTTKDYFWPISQSDLLQNNNLLQNYGW
jgi:starch-binding outer membrane protein, SusD/RagB family